MKTNIIDNTEWITNIFGTNDDVYFVDCILGDKQTNISRISNEVLYENLNNKNEIGRKFLSNPNPFKSNLLDLSETEVVFCEKVPGYVQNIFEINNKIYKTILMNGSTDTLDENNINIDSMKDKVYLCSFNNKILIKDINNKKIAFLNEKFDLINNLDIKALDILKIADNFIMLDENNKVLKLDQNFKVVKVIDDTNEDKKIGYLNNKNVIISYKDSKKTKAINIDNLQEQLISENFSYRVFNFKMKFLIIKQFFNKYEEIDLLMPIVAIK